MNTRSAQGFILFTAIFIASLVTSTLLGSKLLLIGGVTISAGLFIFPFTFVANEIVTEVYGTKTARFLVSCGIVIQLYVLFFVWLGGAIPASPARDLTEPYRQMFSLAPRMVIASIVAYLCSQFLDIEVFHRIRKLTHGRFLWLRANLASYISQALDTTVFTLIFLYGIVPLSDLFLTGLTSYVVKVIVCTLDTPLVYLGVKVAKKLDQKNAPGLQVIAVKTDVYTWDQNLVAFLIKHLPLHLMTEGVIIAITSKIISLSERRTVPRKEAEGSEAARSEKKALIEKESDHVIAETLHQVFLTIKHGIFIPSAGIDESNAKDKEYILFPEDPYTSAEIIGKALRKHYRLEKLGIILTDSHTTPLRNGVSGIGLSHFGFKAVRNLKGQPDLFGREMKMTQVNVLDALSVAAVYEMGETNDSKPIAIIQAEGIEFTEKSERNEIHIPMEQDLYGHFFKKTLKED